MGKQPEPEDIFGLAWSIASFVVATFASARILRAKALKKRGEAVSAVCHG